MNTFEKTRDVYLSAALRFFRLSADATDHDNAKSFYARGLKMETLALEEWVLTASQETHLGKTKGRARARFTDSELDVLKLRAESRVGELARLARESLGATDG